MTGIFFDKLTAVLEQHSSFRCLIIICGDFNIHVDIGDDLHAVHLTHALESFDYIQYVNKPTHHAQRHTANESATFFADKVESIRLPMVSVPLQDIPFMTKHTTLGQP